MGKTRQKMKRKKAQVYSEEFKRKVCAEYLETGGSKVALLRKYGISFRSAIQTWLKEFGYEDIYHSGSPRPKLLPHQLTLSAEEELMISENASLKEKNACLEKSLLEAELKNALYEEMIRLAETKWGIEIEKKSVTKPSGQ